MKQIMGENPEKERKGENKSLTKGKQVLLLQTVHIKASMMRYCEKISNNEFNNINRIHTILKSGKLHKLENKKYRL